MVDDVDVDVAIDDVDDAVVVDVVGGFLLIISTGDCNAHAISSTYLSWFRCVGWMYNKL